MYSEGSSKAIFAIFFAVLVVVIAANWHTTLFLLQFLGQLIYIHLQPLLERVGIHLPSPTH
jgi:hypothetical protein